MEILHELEALEAIEREDEPGGRLDNVVYKFKHAMLREVLEVPRSAHFRFIRTPLCSAAAPSCAERRVSSCMLG